MRGRLQRIGVLRESGHEHFNGSLVIPISDPQGGVLSMYGRKITANLREGTPLNLYLPGAHKGVWNEAAPEVRAAAADGAGAEASGELEGGQDGGCHLFRHTVATLMLENGADIRVIQQMLGHAKLDTTHLYTRVSINLLKQVYAATHPAAHLCRGVDVETARDAEAEAELFAAAGGGRSGGGRMIELWLNCI